MEGSVLTVTVIEARELHGTSIRGGSNAYVLLSIEGQKSQTEVVSGSNDPVWNDIITFDIIQGKEMLTCQVFDKAEIGRDKLLG